jgi:hypothetical protein
MYPFISPSMAAQHAMDLRKQAAAAQRAQRARQARRARRATGGGR